MLIQNGMVCILHNMEVAAPLKRPNHFTLLQSGLLCSTLVGCSGGSRVGRPLFPFSPFSQRVFHRKTCQPSQAYHQHPPARFRQRQRQETLEQNRAGSFQLPGVNLRIESFWWAGCSSRWSGDTRMWNNSEFKVNVSIPHPPTPEYGKCFMFFILYLFRSSLDTLKGCWFN